MIPKVNRIMRSKMHVKMAEQAHHSSHYQMFVLSAAHGQGRLTDVGSVKGWKVVVSAILH